MKTNKQQDSFEKLQEEEIKNTEIVSSDEEISENNEEDNSPQNNLASFITTPYERVLSIINEAKAFILSVSTTQQNLIKGLEWAIKVISSHNLYAYELKDQEDEENQNWNNGHHLYGISELRQYESGNGCYDKWHRYSKCHKERHRSR